MKYTTTSIDTNESVLFKEQSLNENYLNVEETIIPSSYILALMKEKKCLKLDRNKTFPTLKDLLKSDSKDHLDPLLISQSLDLLLNGKLSYIENEIGNVQFLKFRNPNEVLSSSSLDLKKNCLNLDKIPIYVITTEKNDFLTFKVFKKQEYILGFLNFEDAFIYLNDLQNNKLWQDRKGASFNKLGNLKNAQSFKIRTYDFESFYKIWVANEVKTTLIPGSLDFGIVMYMTKYPFYNSECKNVFLTSFSKKALKETLYKAKANNQKIMSIDTNMFFELSNKMLENSTNFYYFIPHQNPYLDTNFSAEELKIRIPKDLDNEFNSLKVEDDNVDSINSIILPSGFLPFLPISIRTSLYSKFQNWSERVKSDNEKRQKRRIRRKKRRKYIKQRFSLRRKTRRYFRKSDIYKKMEDRDRYFLNSHKAQRLDNFSHTLENTQKKWLRGLFEKTPSRSYPGVFNRKSKKFNPDTWRILKFLKKEKTLSPKKQIFKIPKKRRLTAKKIWRLRQLFFKKKILQKHSNYQNTLDKTKQLINNINQYPYKKDLSINEFLEKFKVLELEQRKYSDQNKSALVESFVYKK